MQEIKKYQKSSALLIRKAPFNRLVREISNSFSVHSESVIRWQAGAVMALQEAVEAYLVSLFEASQICAIHAKRIIITKHDMDLAKRIGGNYKL